MKNIVLAVGAIALAAGAAQAALFSFASDRNPDGPTFSGLASSVITDGGPQDANGAVTVSFLVDRDDDGPGVAQVIEGRFEFNAVITAYSVVGFSGQFNHQFALDGSMSIIDTATNLPVFVAAFDNALFSSWSNSQASLGRSAQMQDSDESDLGLSFATFGALADIDVSAQRDFGFSLSNVRLANGNRVPVNQGALGTPWRAEGSFSAHAVPTPGALALGALGGLVMARRRRI